VAKSVGRLFDRLVLERLSIDRVQIHDNICTRCYVVW
jgi:hypothetical protein